MEVDFLVILIKIKEVELLVIVTMSLTDKITIRVVYLEVETVEITGITISLVIIRIMEDFSETITIIHKDNYLVTTIIIEVDYLVTTIIIEVVDYLTVTIEAIVTAKKEPLDTNLIKNIISYLLDLGIIAIAVNVKEVKMEVYFLVILTPINKELKKVIYLEIRTPVITIPIIMQIIIIYFGDGFDFKF